MDLHTTVRTLAPEPPNAPARSFRGVVPRTGGVVRRETRVARRKNRVVFSFFGVKKSFSHAVVPFYRVEKSFFGVAFSFLDEVFSFFGVEKSFDGVVFSFSHARKTVPKPARGKLFGRAAVSEPKEASARCVRRVPVVRPAQGVMRSRVMNVRFFPFATAARGASVDGVRGQRQISKWSSCQMAK